MGDAAYGDAGTRQDSADAGVDYSGNLRRNPRWALARLTAAWLLVTTTSKRACRAGFPMWCIRSSSATRSRPSALCPSNPGRPLSIYPCGKPASNKAHYEHKTMGTIAPLRTAVRVVGRRQTDEGGTSRRSYCFSSQAGSAERLLPAIRSHGTPNTRCTGHCTRPFEKTDAASARITSCRTPTPC